MLRIAGTLAGSAQPRGTTWKGAGGWLIFSQSRQEKRSRTVWTTFHRRGTTSNVSVTSSPSFDSRPPPQVGHAHGAGTTTRSRGRCAGNGCRDGELPGGVRVSVDALVDAGALARVLSVLG